MGEFANALHIGSDPVAPPSAGGLQPSWKHAHPALARFGAVLSTYPRRWHFRLCALLFVAFLFLVLLIPSDVRGRSWILLVQLCSVCVMFTGMLTEHAKEQLLDARARLTPAYRWPHVLVWLFAMLVAMVLLPAATARFVGPDAPVNRVPPTVLSPAGVAAFVSVWAAAIAWCGYYPSLWTLVPLAGLVSLLSSATVRDQWLDMLAGHAPRTAAGVLAVSLATIVPLAWRMLTADEESPDWRRSTTNWGLRAGMTGDPSLREAAEPTGRSAGPLATLASRSDWLVRRTGRELYREPPGALVGAHWWWRVRHYRLVSTAACRPAALGVMIVAVFTILVTVVALNDRSPADALKTGMMIVAALVGLFPGVIVGLLWPRRWLTVSYEAMLPSTRPRFVLEAGAAMLIDQLVLWLACQLSALLPFALVALVVDRLTSPVVPTEYLAFLLMLLVAAVPQLLVFGIVTLVMRLRSAIFSFLILFPVALVPFLPFALAQRFTNGHSHWPEVAVAYAVTGLLGVLSIVVSYLLWRDAEFE